MTQNAVMARKRKPKSDQSSDEQYRKPARMSRVRESLAAQLDILVEQRASDFTAEVNRAVREMLERASLWPPLKPEA